MGLSKEDRKLLYTKMYTAVSKATAETKNAKGEAIKVTYNGKIVDLFDGICNNAPTIRAFMWAVSHKTDALPTALFRVVSRGVNGTEISRIHSGFYDDQRNHITGTALIPFIMEAMKLWEPKPRVKKEPVAILPVEAPKLPEYAKLPVSPDQLTDAELDAAIQEIQATLNAFVSERDNRAKLVAKKRELFKAVSELIEGEGFTLDEIMQIVWNSLSQKKMNEQELRARVLDDSRSLISSVERYDYDNAYRNAKAVCENLLLLLEEEMYKGNNND